MGEPFLLEVMRTRKAAATTPGIAPDRRPNPRNRESTCIVVLRD